MVQLWVNLPARDKMGPPAYQTLLDAQIPQVALPGNAGRLRVIAGAFDGQPGPARTHTPIDVWDLRLNAGAQVKLPLHAGHTAAVVVLRGTVLLNGGQVLRESQVARLDRAGDALEIEANGEAVLLFLGGEPIAEPVVGHGPFVMNTQDEIVQAMEDFQSGRFGRLPAATAA
jgi:hypothetical protein